MLFYIYLCIFKCSLFTHMDLGYSLMSSLFSLKDSLQYFLGLLPITELKDIKDINFPQVLLTQHWDLFFIFEGQFDWVQNPWTMAFLFHNCLLASMVFDKKLVVNLTEGSLYAVSHFSLLTGFFVFGYLIMILTYLWYGSLQVYSTCSSLSFLDVHNVFIKYGNFLAIYLFKYSFCLFLSHHSDFIMHILVHLMASLQVSEALLIFKIFLILFSFCSLAQVS